MRYIIKKGTLSKRDIFLNLLLSFSALLTCFIIGEIVIRNFGVYDNDGNYIVRKGASQQSHTCAERMKVRLDAYLSSSSSAKMYDPDLGWTFRPNAESRNGLYYYNSDGIRTNSTSHEYTIYPQTQILRIAIFGDSFTHGSDVPFENTWGYYLENILKGGGIDTEVLNFGVSAYGMDQAFLRWKKNGSKYSPHLVIFGFQPVNVKRNVNLIRCLQRIGTGIPFTKPRYVLEGEDLRLVNIPTVEPIMIPNIIRNIDNWELVKYEYYYNQKDYGDHVWYKSRLLSFVITAISRKNSRSIYSLNSEPAIITLKIIQQFKKDVEYNGGKFIVVHLPRKSDMRALLNEKSLPYYDLLKKLEEFSQVIHPEHEMLKKAKSSSIASLYIKHYSPRGNKIIADTIARFLVKNRIGKLIAQRQHTIPTGLSVAVAPTWAWEAYRYFKEGRAYGKKGQYDAAIASYKEAIRLKPDYAKAHYNLGNAYDDKGLYDDAIAAYKEAIRLKPDYARAHKNLGNAYMKKGDRKPALAEYEWLKTRKPDWAEKLLKSIKKIPAK